MLMNTMLAFFRGLDPTLFCRDCSKLDVVIELYTHDQNLLACTCSAPCHAADSMRTYMCALTGVDDMLLTLHTWRHRHLSAAVPAVHCLCSG